MIFDVQITDLGIIRYNAYNPSTPEPERLPIMQLQADLELNESKQNLKVTIEVKIFLYPIGLTEEEINSISESELTLIGEITTFSLFDLTNLWEQVDFNNSNYPISEKLQEFLINVSYNNTRGLLKERAKNDLIGKLTIPLFAPEILNVQLLKK